MSSKLSAVEERIIDTAGRGVLLDLGPDLPADTNPGDAQMQDWGDERTVRADVLRDLLRGLHPVTGKPFDVDPRGIIVRGAVIRDRLDLDHVRTSIPLSLTLCYLPARVSARYARLGPLRLERCHLAGPPVPLDVTAAHIDGPMSMRGATVVALNGPAVGASGLVVEGTLHLSDGFSAVASAERGAIRLIGAHVTGLFSMGSAEVRNDAGPALSADRLIVDGRLSLTNGFSAVGSGELGTIRLIGAHVSGQFSMGSAQIRNDTGPALSADGLVVDSGLFLNNRFTAAGAGESGAVRLVGAHVGGHFSMGSAQVQNDTGPALDADRLVTESSLQLNNSFSAVGGGRKGAVRCQGAHINGVFSMAGAQVRNTTGPAISADRLVADGGLHVNDDFSAVGSSEHGAVRLHSTRFGGPVTVPPSVAQAAHSPQRQWSVDGMTYAGVPSCGVGQWLRLLESGTPRYMPQAYQQLAAAASAQGHEADARQVLIAQRRDQLSRGDLGKGRQAWTRFIGLTLGFGYQPWRALLGVLASVAVALLLALGVWPDAFFKPLPDPSTQHVACSTAELAGLALDASLPLVAVPWAGECTPSSSGYGNAWRVASLGLQLLSWASATLFVAGFTSVVRRP